MRAHQPMLSHHWRDFGVIITQPGAWGIICSYCASNQCFISFWTSANAELYYLADVHKIESFLLDLRSINHNDLLWFIPYLNELRPLLWNVCVCNSNYSFRSISVYVITWCFMGHFQNIAEPHKSQKSFCFAMHASVNTTMRELPVHWTEHMQLDGELQDFKVLTSVQGTRVHHMISCIYWIFITVATTKNPNVMDVMVCWLICFY